MSAAQKPKENGGDGGEDCELAPKAPRAPVADNVVDFSDPEQLAEALSASNLTDQEEEELLKQALIINRKLKEELLLREECERVQASRNRLGSGRKPTLPPIEASQRLEKKKQIYATSKSADYKVNRSTSKAAASAGQHRKSPSAGSPRKSGSSAPPGVTRSKTTLEPKPQWNNRFSYE